MRCHRKLLARCAIGRCSEGAGIGQILGQQGMGQGLYLLEEPPAEIKQVTSALQSTKLGSRRLHAQVMQNFSSAGLHVVHSACLAAQAGRDVNHMLHACNCLGGSVRDTSKAHFLAPGYRKISSRDRRMSILNS